MPAFDVNESPIAFTLQANCGVDLGLQRHGFCVVNGFFYDVRAVCSTRALLGSCLTPTCAGFCNLKLLHP
eukprot:11267371-Karenia_brevis.AAC.1